MQNSNMRNIYTVGQINSYIKNMFTQDFLLRSVIVSGEVSNVKYHSSGHIYFTMKDRTGAISCVMFAGNAARLKFRLKEGQLVEAEGSVSVYERDGKYQLYVTGMNMAGAGLLYEKYEQLKKELEEMGMFDASYKRPIPKFIGRLGVVTASTGAAVRDIIQISKRRNPCIEIILYPAQVQGEGAKESIVAGIRTLDEYGVDVIIVGRGGGSIEDLWAFNEECVARAIFDCNTPIISAVGHETDTTIADFVADLRAPTPSAAAELAVYSQSDVIREIHDRAFNLEMLMERVIRDRKNRVREMSARMEALSPESKIREKRLNYVNRVQQLDALMARRIDEAKHRLELTIRSMKALSPLERISGGYAYVADAKGINIKSVENITPGDVFKLIMKDGIVQATADTVEKVNFEERA